MKHAVKGNAAVILIASMLAAGVGGDADTSSSKMKLPGAAQGRNHRGGGVSSLVIHSDLYGRHVRDLQRQNLHRQVVDAE
jgi:hypothetical protein